MPIIDMSPFGDSFLELLANNYSNHWSQTKKEKQKVLFKLRFMNKLLREYNESHTTKYREGNPHD